MKNIKFCIMLILGISSSLFMKGVTRDDFLNLSLNGVPYRLFVPEDYSASTEYPLVLFLHGGGASGSDNESQLDDWAMLYSQDSIQKRYQSFVLVPQTNSGWANGNRGTVYTMYSTMGSTLSTVVDIISNIRSEYNIDSTRLYVTGLSMGSFGTWDLIMRKPDMFAAAIAICGGGDTTYAETIKDIPLRVFHSADDGTITVKYSRDMDTALLAAGATDYAYKEYEDLGHSCWTTAYLEDGLTDWFFSHRKYFYDDDEPPTAPDGLVASDISYTSFKFSWNQSTDNVHVSSYNAYVDGELVYSGGDTAVAVSDVKHGSEHIALVEAIDENDNVSEMSDTLKVTTLVSEDKEVPSQPTGVSVVRTGQTNFTLDWQASTDNVGVAAYDIYLNGVLDGSTDTTTTYTATGLTISTDYAVYVVARDLVNNSSEKSSEVDVTTLDACSETISWTNTSISDILSGTFTVEFDITPDGDNMNGLIGLTSGDISSFSGFSTIVRFYYDGVVDAYNLGTATGYDAENQYPYYYGETYHVRMVVDVSANTYDVYIKRDGEEEVTIASDYKFRASATTLNNYAMYSLQCTFSVENFTISGGVSDITDLNEDQECVIYPNPANDEVTIKVMQKSEFKLYDLSERLIMTDIIEAGENKILLNLNAGTYLISVKGENGMVSASKLMVK